MDLNPKINDFRTLFWMGYVNDDFAKIMVSPGRNTIFSGLDMQKITEICSEKACENFLANKMNFDGLGTRFWGDFGGLGRGLGRF